ncbi:DNA-processing protein DprA, partial [Streptococcus suis]
LNNRFLIVSGFARGIDTAAQIASFKNVGQNIAVILTGLYKIYPKQNKDFQKKILKKQYFMTHY